MGEAPGGAGNCRDDSGGGAKVIGRRQLPEAAALAARLWAGGGGELSPWVAVAKMANR